MGLGGVPMAGEEFDGMDSENDARDAADQRRDEDRINVIEGNTVSLSNLAAAKDDEDGVQTINVIVKTDVSGSVEAVKAALGALPQDRVILRFLHAAAGEVTAAAARASLSPDPTRANRARDARNDASASRNAAAPPSYER